MDSACLLKNGSPELKQRFLPGIADGTLSFALRSPSPTLERTRSV
jgi:hypothetical protein